MLIFRSFEMWCCCLHFSYTLSINKQKRQSPPLICRAVQHIAYLFVKTVNDLVKLFVQSLINIYKLILREISRFPGSRAISVEKPYKNVYTSVCMSVCPWTWQLACVFTHHTHTWQCGVCPVCVRWYDWWRTDNPSEPQSIHPRVSLAHCARQSERTTHTHSEPVIPRERERFERGVKAGVSIFNMGTITGSCLTDGIIHAVKHDTDIYIISSDKLPGRYMEVHYNAMCLHSACDC